MSPGGRSSADDQQSRASGIENGEQKRRSTRRLRIARRLVRWLVGVDVELATRGHVLYEDARISRLRADHDVGYGALFRELNGIGAELLKRDAHVDERLDEIEKMAADQPEAFLAAKSRADYVRYIADQKAWKAGIEQRVAASEAKVTDALDTLGRSASWVASELRAMKPGA